MPLMRAVRVEADQSLSVVEVADPFVGPSGVLIEVRASGLNRADLAQRAGNYPPPPGASEVLGLEVAGTVREVGEDVADWQPGDRVCALLAGGGYAELAVADEGSVFAVPEGMDFVDAACLPEAMMTVWPTCFYGAACSRVSPSWCMAALVASVSWPSRWLSLIHI